MWWQKNFSEETALDFLKECHEFSESFLNKTKNLDPGKIKTSIQYSKKFTPIGAVVDVSRTINVQDFLRFVSYHGVGTHFFITSSSNPIKTGLLSEVPTIPFFFNKLFSRVVNHAAYLSTLTYGITLRNVGILRPYQTILNSNPAPIFPNEGSKKIFQLREEFDVPIKFYYWENLWREIYEKENHHGKSLPYKKIGDYYWEIPTFQQITTLIIILKVLNKLTPLQRDLILPSHLCCKSNNYIPGINWNEVRNCAFKTKKVNNKNFNLPEWYSRKREFAMDINASNESHLRDLLRFNKWKFELNKGELKFLFKNTIKNNINIDGINKFYKEIGYDPDSHETNLKLFSITNGHINVGDEDLKHQFIKYVTSNHKNLPKHFTI